MHLKHLSDFLFTQQVKSHRIYSLHDCILLELRSNVWTSL